MPPRQGVSGVWYWEKALGPTQDTLWRLYFLAGLEMPHWPPRWTGKAEGWFSAKRILCCPDEPNLDKCQNMDGWMDGWGHPALPVLAPSLDKWPVANPWKIREQSHLQKTARQLTDLNKTIKNEQVAEFTIKKNIVNNTVSDSSIIYESWIQTMKKEIFVV